MDTPGHYSWLIGYGWEAVATDPNGEVHLKELIYLQITMYVCMYMCVYVSVCNEYSLLVVFVVGGAREPPKFAR